MNLKEITKNSKTSIVDVRSKMEFIFGNAKWSSNIPLNKIEEKLKDLERMQSF